MIGDLFNNNKRKDVCTREDQVMRFNKKWREDKKTGYYICTTGERKRLHVKVWERFWGVSVPEDCVIHHLDWNKKNNNIENLICVTVAEHEKIHNKMGGREGKSWGYNLIETRVKGLPPGMSL